MPPGNTTNNCSQSATNPTGCGGFTVGSENPVYIVGNYNSNCYTVGDPSCNPGTTAANLDLTWNQPPTAATEPIHSAASVIADAVTLLSNNWQDWGCLTVSAACSNTGVSAIQQYAGSMTIPISGGASPYDRYGLTTYYRVAIAGGKTIAFNNGLNNPDAYFGMDGGVHNFLRFLENYARIADRSRTTGKAIPCITRDQWSACTGTSTPPAHSSAAPWCTNPPNRQYYFDPLFASTSEPAARNAYVPQRGQSELPSEPDRAYQLTRRLKVKPRSAPRIGVLFLLYSLIMGRQRTRANPGPEFCAERKN